MLLISEEVLTFYGERGLMVNAWDQALVTLDFFMH